MKSSSFVAAIAIAACMQTAGATVVDSADVNGLHTFRDTNTGRIWLDLNNFYDANGNSTFTAFGMVQAAQNAGFTVATGADLSPLLASLPLDSSGSLWSSYASVMGADSPRHVIWGTYNDGTLEDLGWGYAYVTETSWTMQANTVDPLLIAAGAPPGQQDLGLWAYLTASVVPEPDTLALVGVGLAGLLAGLKRRQGQEPVPSRGTLPA